MIHYGGVVKTLQEGGVGLLPSDTIYGLSCSALNETAVQRIYRLKGRRYDKPLIILLADIEQANSVGLNTRELRPMNKIWPAQLTLILPAGRETPEFLHRGKRTLAIRVPADDKLTELLKLTGPLVSTSANPEGKSPSLDIKQARDYFGNKLDFYVDVGPLKAEASTIVRFKKGQVEVIRQGAFKV